jgi:hypothetical protein
MLGLQANPSPLYRATVARIAEAAAGAGCGGHLVCSVEISLSLSASLIAAVLAYLLR